MTSSFVSAEPPRRADTDACVRCGLCLSACPTFRLLGDELDSPRGRIYQVAQADAGRLPLSPGFALHMDRCLDCRACVTACPSGVPYGDIIERARGELLPLRRGAAHRLQGWALERAIPNRGRLRRLAALLRWYQHSGLQTLARRSGLLRRLGLADAEALCPRIPPAADSFDAAIGQTFAPLGPRRARVAFFPGCAQNALLPQLNYATLRVLRRQGCEVVIPAGFGCCGALHVHAGRRDFARTLARANIAAAAGLQVDAIVTNAAGCGAALKEYPGLFQNGSSSGAHAPDPFSAPFSAQVKDVTEFLAALPLETSALGPLPVTVAYQDACHLAHAQGIRAAPRQLLAAIPGLQLRPLERADQCCGGAGIYNLSQPAIAAALLADRVAAFRQSGAQVLATANPGCSLQLASALGPDAVLHVIELLDLSTRASESASE